MINNNSIDLSHLKLFIMDDIDFILLSKYEDAVVNIIDVLQHTVQFAIFGFGLFIYLFIYLSLCLFIYLFICLSIYLSIYFICLFIHYYLFILLINSNKNPEDILSLFDDQLHNPLHILLKINIIPPHNQTHFFVDVEKDENKLDTLIEIFEMIKLYQCIVFCNSKERITSLYESLINCHFIVSCIHKHMERNQYYENFEDFKLGRSRILITDDSSSANYCATAPLIINYDFPERKKEEYLNRIISCCCFGRRGFFINFVTNKDYDMFCSIQKLYNIKIEELPNNFPDIIL